MSQAPLGLLLPARGEEEGEERRKRDVGEGQVKVTLRMRNKGTYLLILNSVFN